MKSNDSAKDLSSKTNMQKFEALIFEFKHELCKVYSVGYIEQMGILIITFIQFLYFPLRSEVSTLNDG